MRYLHGYLYIPMFIRVVYYVISLLMPRGGVLILIEARLQKIHSDGNLFYGI